MRKKIVVLLGIILVGTGVCFLVKENTTKSLSKEVYEEDNNKSVDGYVEHIVNPDGTMSEKIVDEDEAKQDVESTVKNGRTTASSWVSYVENPDGTYTSCLGVTYKYMKKVEVTGKEYWVLSNKEDVTKEDALKLLSASSDANYIQWGMEFVHTK